MVSFDDLEWFDLMRPRISAVANPAYDLGAHAADVLVRRITGKLKGAPQRKILAARLVVRESSSSGRDEARAFSESEARTVARS